VRKHVWPLSQDVLAEPDRATLARQRCQRRPAGFDREAAQIVAVKLHEIESVEHGNVTGTSTAQRLEVCQPVRTDHDCLAVDREGIRLEARRGLGSPGSGRTSRGRCV
jgi:hypothetical protein